MALLRIVSKGLKEPGDKLQLIKVLSLGQVIDALETKTRSQQTERGSDVDEGEESYREALGKLLNVLGLELRTLVDVSAQSISSISSCSLTFSSGYPEQQRNIVRSIYFTRSNPSSHASFHGRRI